MVFKLVSLYPHAVAQEIWDSIEKSNVVIGIGLHKAALNGNGQHITNSWIVQSDGIVSLGCVLKDPTTNIFLAASNRLSSHVDASTIEILVIWWCLKLAKELKIESFTLQSDALVLVDCINGVDFSTALDPIVNDCKLLLGAFNDATLMYVSRDINVNAHQMVGVGKFLGSRT